MTRTIASKDTESTNPPRLTEKGIAHVKESAEELANKGIGIIYSSPYVRTMETANIIAEKFGIEVLQDKRLEEIDAGILDGKSIDEYRAFFENDEEELTKKTPGGENLLDVRDRVKEFLEEVEEKYDGEKILIVGHGASLMALEAIYSGKGILEVDYKTGEWRALS